MPHMNVISNFYNIFFFQQELNEVKYTNTFSYTYCLIKKNTTLINETDNNDIIIDQDESIEKLVGICTKDGKKNRAISLVQSTNTDLVSSYSNSLYDLLKTAMYKIQHFLRIRLINMRSRQKIFSNFLLTLQQDNLSLRTINKHALENSHLFNQYHQSLSSSIIYYSFLDNMSDTQVDPLLVTMHENNEIISLNTHFFYRRIRYSNRKITGRRRFKLIHLYKNKEQYYEK